MYGNNHVRLTLPEHGRYNIPEHDRHNKRQIFKKKYPPDLCLKIKQNTWIAWPKFNRRKRLYLVIFSPGSTANMMLFSQGELQAKMVTVRYLHSTAQSWEQSLDRCDGRWDWDVCDVGHNGKCFMVNESRVSKDQQFSSARVSGLMKESNYSCFY